MSSCTFFVTAKKKKNTQDFVQSNFACPTHRIKMTSLRNDLRTEDEVFEADVKEMSKSKVF